MDEVEALASQFKTLSGHKQIMKPGQKRIFETIIQREHPRNAVLCHTRYGKDMTIAEAILVSATVYAEPWVIIGPTKTQAETMMRQLIQHLFDSPRFYSQLAIDMPLDRLRRDRKKDRLTFRRGGEVSVLTADARNTRRIGALLGAGCKNIVLNEAPLIPDPIEAMVIRMLADSADNFLVKVGNAFERNHFKRAFSDSKYHKIIIDCYQGLRESKDLPYDEGRLTQETIDEAKTKPFFGSLWECKFPKTDQASLFDIEVIEKAMAMNVEPKGKPKLGVDIGRGGDPSAFVIRYDNYARMIEKNFDKDLMVQVGKIQKYMEEYKILGIDVFVDDIAVGGGVTDRCREKDIHVTAVTAGSTPRDTERFKNVKAEAYWEAKIWLEQGGALANQDEFRQLEEIRGKEDSSRRLQIESKEEMKKRTGSSLDVADAFMHTFAPQETIPEVMVL